MIETGRETQRRWIVSTSLAVLSCVLIAHSSFLSPLGQIGLVCLVLSIAAYIARRTVRRNNELLSARLSALRKSTEDAGHELATPVSILRSKLQVLERQHSADLSTDNLKELLETTERMTSLIDGLRTLVETESCQIYHDLSIVKFDALIRKIVARLRPLSERSGITLTVDSVQSIMVVADPDGIERVLLNLLGNACKYSSEGSVVKVSLSEEPKQIVLTVADTGCGISHENLPHIFDRFYRVSDEQSKSKAGTGLGLAIVKAIVSSHGGTITVESAINEGTTFKVYLPQYPREHPFKTMLRNR